MYQIKTGFFLNYDFLNDFKSNIGYLWTCHFSIFYALPIKREFDFWETFKPDQFRAKVIVQQAERGSQLDQFSPAALAKVLFFWFLFLQKFN